jgi:hypothetical protein
VHPAQQQQLLLLQQPHCPWAAGPGPFWPSQAGGASLRNGRCVATACSGSSSSSGRSNGPHAPAVGPSSSSSNSSSYNNDNSSSRRGLLLRSALLPPLLLVGSDDATTIVNSILSGYGLPTLKPSKGFKPYDEFEDDYVFECE